MYDAWQLKDVDPFLTNFSVGYEAQDLVGLRIMPQVSVGVLAGKYRVYDRRNWMIYPDVRAQGAVANEVAGGGWSSDTFSVEEHSLQAPVEDAEREMAASANADFGIGNPESDAVEAITNSLLLGHEKAVADLVRNTGTYPVDNVLTLTGTQRWNDYTTGDSDPIQNFRDAIDTLWRSIRRKPTLAVFSYDAWTVIENHPVLVDRFKNFTLTKPDAFKELTGFAGEILIAESAYNAADNIDDAEDIQDLWGQDVWLGVVDPQPSQNSRTFGKTFVYPYQGQTRPVDRWREESRKSDLFRVTWRYDLKVTSSAAGFIMKTVVDAP